MLTGCIDQGGDGLSASNAMTHKKKLNWFCFMDWSHGACNDLDKGYNKTGNYPFMLLFLVVLNLPHGPEKDEGMRYQQMLECWQYLFNDDMGAENNVLFQARGLDILQERQEVGVCFNSLRELWQAMQSEMANKKKGYRAKLCQFMSWIRRVKEFLSVWHETLFLCETIALELDMLEGKEFKKQILVKAPILQEAAKVKSTDSSLLQIESRILKSACKNAVACTVALCERPEVHKRKLAIMVEIPWPLAVWQGQAAKDMKDTDANSTWLLGGLGSNFMKHKIAILKQLTTYSVLRRCGFEMTALPDDDELDGILAIEDECAKMAGSLAVQVVANREVRLGYVLYCYPGPLFKLPLGGTTAQSVCNDFQKDVQVEGVLESWQDKSPELKEMLARSCIKPVAVQQFQNAFEELGYQPHPEIVSLSIERAGGIITTHPVEDIHNVQKNSGQVRGTQKFRKPQRAMAVAISKQVLHKRHSYKARDVDSVHIPKTMALSGSAFEREKIKPSIDLSGIATTTQKAPYSSHHQKTLQFQVRILQRRGLWSWTAEILQAALSTPASVIVRTCLCGGGLEASFQHWTGTLAW